MLAYNLNLLTLADAGDLKAVLWNTPHRLSLARLKHEGFGPRMGTQEERGLYLVDDPTEHHTLDERLHHFDRELRWLGFGAYKTPPLRRRASPGAETHRLAAINAKLERPADLSYVEYCDLFEESWLLECQPGHQKLQANWLWQTSPRQRKNKGPYSLEATVTKDLIERNGGQSSTPLAGQFRKWQKKSPPKPL